MTQLCEALAQNDYLQTLILETNSVGDEGAQVIAAFMEGMCGGVRVCVYVWENV